MKLPPLIRDFRHATIQGVTVGPRREVTLAIAPLAWHGHNGDHSETVCVRFGGIINFDEVTAFFAATSSECFELAWLRYAEALHSTPNNLFFELVAERIDASLIIQCSSLQVDDPTAAFRAPI